MTILRSVARLALVSCCSATALLAQHPPADLRPALLVSADWLAQHVNDPDLVLLHVGDSAQFAAHHIPGAHLVTQGDLALRKGPTGNDLEMPSADSLRQALEAIGISDKSRVIVYFAQAWVSPSTRVLFTLDHAGLGANASLLDGGIEAWTRGGHATTDVLAPPRARGHVSPLHLRPTIVDAAFVRDRSTGPGYSLVDARDTVFYTGARPSGGVNRDVAGHIPGAKSLTFHAVYDSTNALRPRNELEALFTKAGVAPNDTVVAYCHIGQQATALIYAARVLGHPVLLYDGSFTEWSLLGAGYPVVKP
ncbi:MAG: Rhodanese-like protein [Gemmatimonadetes bacterium]|nr:Rhodanese-like protein [Gemmatimonadota bacterium]